MYRICIEYHAISLQIQVVLEDVKKIVTHSDEPAASTKGELSSVEDGFELNSFLVPINSIGGEKSCLQK